MRYRAFQFMYMLPLLAVVLVSCAEDEPEPLPPPSTSKVLVINEGEQVNGTGTISSYSPSDKSVNHNMFYKANTYPVGSSLYSILVEDDRIFLVMAGTGEILVVNPQSLELMHRIKGLGAPHHILKVAENKYYITDWQEEGVWVLNMNNRKLIKSIFTGMAPEKMVKYEDWVFVANSGSVFSDSTVTMIHAKEDTIMAQIRVGHNPHSMQIDDNDLLWVLCSGIEDQQNPFASTPGSLLSFDLTRDSLEYSIQDSLVLVDSLVFNDNQLKPIDLEVNEDKSVFYFLDYYKEANLMRFDIEVRKLPNAPFIMDQILCWLRKSSQLPRRNLGRLCRQCNSSL